MRFSPLRTGHNARLRPVSRNGAARSGGAAHGAAMHAGFAIWRIAVHGQRFVGVVVELANPADAARFVAVGDFAAEFARDTPPLLDLLDRTRFALSVPHPEIVFDSPAHNQAHTHTPHFD